MPALAHRLQRQRGFGSLHVVDVGLAGGVRVGEAGRQLARQDESALRVGVDAGEMVHRIGEEPWRGFVPRVDVRDERPGGLFAHSGAVVGRVGVLEHRRGAYPRARAQSVDRAGSEQGSLLHRHEGEVFESHRQHVAGILREFGGFAHEGQDAYLIDDRVVHVARQGSGLAAHVEGDDLAPGDYSDSAEGEGGGCRPVLDGDEVAAVGRVRVALVVNERIPYLQAFILEGPAVGKDEVAVLPVDRAPLVDEAAVAVGVQPEYLYERHAVLGGHGSLAGPGQEDGAVEALRYDVVGAEEVSVAQLVAPRGVAGQGVALLYQLQIERLERGIPVGYAVGHHEYGQNVGLVHRSVEPDRRAVVHENEVLVGALQKLVPPAGAGGVRQEPGAFHRTRFVVVGSIQVVPEDPDVGDDRLLDGIGERQIEGVACGVDVQDRVGDHGGLADEFGRFHRTRLLAGDGGYVHRTHLGNHLRAEQPLVGYAVGDELRPGDRQAHVADLY